MSLSRQKHNNRSIVWIFAGVAVSLLAATWLSTNVFAAALHLKADEKNSEQVKRGKRVYDRFCAFCHGKDLKGQKDWRRRKENGRLPAPPHDETGHTWHHDEELLFGITKYGLVPPYAPKDYKSDMPAWQGTLKDADIWAVLAYIKSRWPEETQKISDEINAERNAERNAD
ncbi:MAG: cytochrome c [Thiohalomonadales bacterium]